MNLMDLLEEAGGGNSVAELSKQLGIGGRDTANLVEALSPALMRGVQKQADNTDTVDGLLKALAGGSHQRYLDKPELATSDAARTDGNKILGHLFGSKDVSRNVAAQAAANTGIDTSLIKKALPLVAGLAMGALGKNTAEAKSDGLSGLLGGLLGSGGGSRDVGDLIGLAKKLF